MYIKTSGQEKIELGFGNYQCNNGMHFAGLYETEKERDEIIFGFNDSTFDDPLIQTKNVFCK